MSGNLVVKPLTAKLTHSTESFGKMDPYCKVIVGSEYSQTGVHKDGGKTPGWNMTLTLRRKENDEFIAFEVFDKDDHSKDDLIGSGTLAIASVVKNKNKYNDWVNLTYKGKSAGTLLVDVEFFPDGGKDKLQQQQQTQQFIQQPNIYQQQPIYQQQTVYQQPNIYQQQQQPIYQQQIQQPIYQQQQFVQQQPIYQQQQFIQQQQPIYQQQQQQFVQQQPIYQQQQQPIYQQGQQQMQFQQQQQYQQQQQQQYPQQGNINIVFK
jgi:Ca2+-dependent lipid-binding protein